MNTESMKESCELFECRLDCRFKFFEPKENLSEINKSDYERFLEESLFEAFEDFVKEEVCGFDFERLYIDVRFRDKNKMMSKYGQFTKEEEK